MRGHVVFLVAGVGRWFEDDRGLGGNLGAAYPAEQLFGFPGKHRPTHDFNAAFTKTGVLQGRMFFVGNHAATNIVFEIRESLLCRRKNWIHF